MMRRTRSTARNFLYGSSLCLLLLAACGERSATDNGAPASRSDAITTAGTQFDRVTTIRTVDRVEFIGGLGDVNGDGYDDAALGQPQYSPEPLEDPYEELGRVYVLFGSPSGVSLANRQILDGTEHSERRAHFVRAGDVNGDGYADVILEGALNYINDTGSYLHLGGPSGLGPTPVWHIPHLPYFPRAYGNVGDVNGDRRSDVMFLLSEFVETTWHGQIVVYGGTTTGLTADPIWSYDITATPTLLHGAGVGDINGDGYSDIVLGSDWCDAARGGQLAAFFGSASGLARAPGWTAETRECTRFGRKVVAVGDVNGDGLAEVAASSGTYASFDFEGAALAFAGGRPPSQQPLWALRFPENLAGWTDISGLGDTNGDGYADVLIGLSYFFNPHNGAFVPEPPMGRARVYNGAASGLPTTNSWWAYDETENGNAFAITAEGAGDLNGDGYADFMVADDYRYKTHVFYAQGGPAPTGRVLRDLQAYESGTGTPLAFGARAQSAHGFDVGSTGLGTQGRTYVGLELEVKPVAAPYNGANLVRPSSWHDTGTAGAALRVSVSGLRSNTAYKYRARLVYRPDTVALTRHTRWFEGGTVLTNCDSTNPDFDADGTCDDLDPDDDGDQTPDTADCAPKNPAIHPGAREIPGDGIDQDCSGADLPLPIVDAGSDGPDAAIGSPDAARDAGMDAARDAGSDAARDASTDAAREADAEAAHDAGADSTHDAGADVARDADAAAEHDGAVDAMDRPDARTQDANAETGVPRDAQTNVADAADGGTSDATADAPLSGRGNDQDSDGGCSCRVGRPSRPSAPLSSMLIAACAALSLALRRRTS